MTLAVPAVQPLPGGVILLSGAAVVDAAQCVTAMIDALRRRDGIEAPHRLRLLDRALRVQAAEVMARTRQCAVAGEADPSSLGPVDVAAVEPLTTKEAAAVLGVSLRTAQRLAPGLMARRGGGRWLIDPAAVADLLNDREDQR